MESAGHRDEDEMDMTVEELRCWIQKEVESNKLLNMRKTQLAQMKVLIERKEEQMVCKKVLFNRTRELIAGCEASMKEFYREIDMVYKETDSEDEEEVEPIVIEIDDEDDDVMCVETPQTGNGCEDDTKCEGESSASFQQPPFLSSETPPTANRAGQPPPASTASSSPHRGTIPASGTDGYPNSLSRRSRIFADTQGQIQPGQGCPQKVAAKCVLLDNGKKVVLLSNLQAPRRRYSRNGARGEEEKQEEEAAAEKREEEEEASGTESDASWKPSRGSDRGSGIRTESTEDSDAELIPNAKRRGREAIARSCSRGHPRLMAPHREPKTTTKERKEREANRNPSGTPARTGTGTSSSPASSKPSQGQTGKSQVVLTASATKTPPQLQQEAIKVGMVVLARRSTDTWQQSKILEIRRADKDNRDQYKVDLKEEGIWLPGHHMGFDHTPSLECLYVGVRVLIKNQETNQSEFSSGILAELPQVKNRMRFLVFLDNGTPCYVSLPLLRLVCRPLENISDEDVKDETYRDFLVAYVKQYPYTPMAQYRLGQHINTEHNGVQKRCQVEAIDCSLIHILFHDDQHKEWLYRGSTRLQHFANIKKEALKETPETNSASAQQKSTSASFRSRKHQKPSLSSAPIQATSRPAKRSPSLTSVEPGFHQSL